MNAVIIQMGDYRRTFTVSYSVARAVETVLANGEKQKKEKTDYFEKRWEEDERG